jgi:hypothetical protein
MAGSSPTRSLASSEARVCRTSEVDKLARGVDPVAENQKSLVEAVKPQTESESHQIQRGER